MTDLGEVIAHCVYRKGTRVTCRIVFDGEVKQRVWNIGRGNAKRTIRNAKAWRNKQYRIYTAKREEWLDSNDDPEPCSPCWEWPGTPEKIEIMRQRVENQQMTFSDDDPRFG